METLLKPRLDVSLVVEDRKHFYDVKGHGRLPGVTGYLDIIDKKALLPWVMRESLEYIKKSVLEATAGPGTWTPDEHWIDKRIEEAKTIPASLRDSAAAHGSSVHAEIDRMLKAWPNQIPSKSLEDAPGAFQTSILSFRQWWAQAGLELVMGDTPVASTTYQYGGSLDCLAQKDGKFVIVDFKTSARIYPTAALQVAAYSQALLETYGIEAQEAWVVRFGKEDKPKFEVKKVAHVGESLHAFLLAKGLSDFLKTTPYRKVAK